MLYDQAQLACVYLDAYQVRWRERGRGEGGGREGRERGEGERGGEYIEFTCFLVETLALPCLQTQPGELP